MADSDNTNKAIELWGQFTRWVKSKIPVSRARYERELSLLRLSVNRSIEEEKHQLGTMIDCLYYVTLLPSQNGQRELRASMRVTDDLIYFCRSPYHRSRLFYEISERTAKLLEKDMMA